MACRIASGSAARSSTRGGFTLIELIVVMAIVALLATLALPRYFHSVDHSKETVLRENLRIVRETIDKFYGDTGRYPDSLEELVERKYLRTLPVDPSRRRLTAGPSSPPTPTPKVACTTLRAPRPAMQAMANRSLICKPSLRAVAAGFTYIGLLILLAIISIGATATVQLGAVTQRRSAEEELLHIGRQFRAALASYQNSTPGGMPRLPKELIDLTKDPRQPVLRRHLRHIPIDPITGKAEWGVVRTPDGFVEAIHSPSKARPLKIANFEPDFAAFEGSQKYSEWEFGRVSPRPIRRQ